MVIYILIKNVITKTSPRIWHSWSRLGEGSHTDKRKTTSTTGTVSDLSERAIQRTPAVQWWLVTRKSQWYCVITWAQVSDITFSSEDFVHSLRMHVGLVSCALKLPSFLPPTPNRNMEARYSRASCNNMGESRSMRMDGALSLALRTMCRFGCHWRIQMWLEAWGFGDIGYLIQSQYGSKNHGGLII